MVKRVPPMPATTPERPKMSTRCQVRLMPNPAAAVSLPRMAARYLVTGPTGSGKSTSLYAFLASINSVTKRIITIEEPVEYELKGINQLAVRGAIGLKFSMGLRHILRQDPNVVMVGEIRD